MNGGKEKNSGIERTNRQTDMNFRVLPLDAPDDDNNDDAFFIILFRTPACKQSTRLCQVDRNSRRVRDDNFVVQRPFFFVGWRVSLYPCVSSSIVSVSVRQQTSAPTLFLQVFSRVYSLHTHTLFSLLFSKKRRA